MTDYQQRAKRERDRRYSLRVSITEMAAALGYTRQHLNSVLNGKIESETALDRAKQYLDEIERSPSSRLMAA